MTKLLADVMSGLLPKEEKGLIIIERDLPLGTRSIHPQEKGKGGNARLVKKKTRYVS